MQRDDPSDVGKQQDQQSSAQTGATVQHFVLTSQLQALANQGIISGLHGSASASVQVVGGNSGIQQQPAVVVISTAPLSTSQTSTILSAQALQQQLTGQGLVDIVSHDGQPITISGVNQTAGRGELQIGQPLTLGTTSSGATIGSGTGGTIHHHGQSPSRGSGAVPHTNLQHSLLTMSNNQQPQSAQHTQQRTVSVSVATTSVSSPAVAAAGRVLLEAKPSMSSVGRSLTFPNLTALANQSSAGPPPKKKIKIEENTPASAEIATNRKLILDHKYREMLELKENYIECLTELFFLQNGGNMMDFFLWKKRPTPQLVHFLKSGNMDSDEDDEQGLERKINNEVKVITCSGSNVPLATPVAISTTLPPSVAALNQPGCEVRRLGGRHGMVFGHVQPAIATQIVQVPTTTIIQPRSSSPAPQPGSLSNSQQKSVSITTSVNSLSAPIVSQRTSVSSATTTTVTTSTSTSMSQLQSHLAKAITDTKPLTVHTCHKSTISSPSSNQLSAGSRTPKSPPISPSRLHTRQHNISAVYDGTVGSQEAIVERAKQEAQCMQRVAELRKEGLWSTRRLPKVQEPPRNKSQWDYLLEEMQWLAADFSQERKWKKAAARKLARMVTKHFQDLEQKEVRAEKEEAQKLKKIASQMARQVREFWNNIEKVVQFKQTTRLEEKRKKALDLHLNFIVDQTEKYSTWLTEGLKKDSRTGSSVGGSVISTPEHSIDGGDNEFEPEDEDSDDEETIAKEEADAGQDDTETKDELAALQKEGEVPIEELLKSLPKEVLEKTASVKSEDSESEEKEDKDEEFNASEEEEIDVEETIEEQEKQEKTDYKKEIKELQDEGDMSMEELYKKYAAAYDSDFEMPESSTESESDDDDDDEEDEESDDEDEDVDIEDDDETEVEKEEDVGIEFLMHPENELEQSGQEDTKSQGDFDNEGPGKELTDIAAQAQSLQPKGYTLQTTEVKTAVPFLLKHKLREYQHVGLDWLATMYEKRLNGILADEMGLGKTIQTIALLAHLACEKGIWGPHLIVVPTSVMLNWEMEIKKWCPAFKILTYYGSQKERKLKRQGWTKTNAFHVCITSYKLVIQDHQSFRRKKWKYLILDEAQNIKNFKSQRWQTLLNFSSQRRLLLTGTPLQNSLMELWSLMHFLMPHVFQSHREFKEWFANPLTGMIEGSHEYNESLIRRLHKVLRPFLLRRLKDDVEKQMPKKYEHVIMCHLSKRQRFLYDEFMSQTKTKETLATGHFMSVINILMQLRKVCNHPSLFDPRPITSPFRTEAIVYRTASLALKVSEYDPFQNIDIKSLFPSLADMELDLPAFIAHRVKKLQTNRKLIEEIDSQPEIEDRPKPGKLKSLVFRSVSPMIKSERSSPVDQTTQSQSPIQIKPITQSVTANIPESTVSSKVSPVIKHLTSTVTTTPVATLAPVQPVYTTVTSTPVTSSVQTVQATLQAKVLPQSAGQSMVQTSASHVTTSQPITVQIQQTEQGARLMIPAGQLSQLPAGFIQIVQTSMGQQIIATSSPITTSSQQIVSAPQNVTTSVAVVNGPPTITTMASSSVNTVVTSVTTQVRATPTIQLPSTTAVTAGLKPVMKVSPISTTTPQAANISSLTSSTSTLAQESKPLTSTTMSVPSVRMSVGQSHKVTRSHAKDVEKNRQKSELYLSFLWDKRKERLKKKLDYLARMNKIHCERKPVYGEDLCHSVNIFRTMYETSSIPWTGEGYINCHNVHMCKNPYRPEYFWNRTQVLSEVVHTPEQYLQELHDILSRYTFVTPTVTAPPISMHVSHPPASYLTEERWKEFMLHQEVSPRTSSLHMISTNMLVQFPELRLIQYDCGKLQTLDILLRRLKSGQHRVLIFTQMTRMLDILESFLNFHGHRYLRLDGTTRVEQRQLLMDRFNADPRIFCFILSTRSGGLGVNLTGADTVVFYDSDWNPTMDAQAQDRCHRIGQTRDVHIYRLISEKTVEENILKKANQKRMLGDMAIEGGNFTTAFFKEQTIQELFTEPSGLDSLVKEKNEREKEKQLTENHKGGGDDKPKPKQIVPKVQSETNIMAQFEKALGKAEDETDVTAADQAKAEQKAELAEFDENIPWDEREAERKKEEEDMSRAEQELAMLDKELSPVERYAVAFMEFEMEPLTEELEMAEEDVMNAKKEWELGRLKALKEEEERRAEIEEDEMLFTFSREDAYNKVKTKKKPGKKSGKKRTSLSSPISSSPPTRVTPARRCSWGQNEVFDHVTVGGSGGRTNRIKAAKTDKVVVSKKDKKSSTPTAKSRNKAGRNITIPNIEDNEVLSTPKSVKGKQNIDRLNTSPPQLQQSKSKMPKTQAKQVTPKQIIPKQVTPKQATPKQVTPKQVTPKQVTSKQATPKQVPLKQATPKNPPAQRKTISALQAQAKQLAQAQAQAQQAQTQQLSSVPQQTIHQINTVPSPQSIVGTLPQQMVATPSIQQQNIPQYVTLQTITTNPQQQHQPAIQQVISSQHSIYKQAGLLSSQPIYNQAGALNSQQAVHSLAGAGVQANRLPGLKSQILTPAQLQHLKQIVSKATQNLHPQQVPGHLQLTTQSLSQQLPGRPQLTTSLSRSQQSVHSNLQTQHNTVHLQTLASTQHNPVRMQAITPTQHTPLQMQAITPSQQVNVQTIPHTQQVVTRHVQPVQTTRIVQPHAQQSVQIVGQTVNQSPHTQQAVQIVGQTVNQSPHTQQAVQIVGQTVNQSPNTPQSIQIVGQTVSQSPHTQQSVQIVGQTVSQTPHTQQSVQIVGQTVTQSSPAIQPVAITHSSTQPQALQFIKVNTGSGIIHQPVLQYCVNTLGQSGSRVQTINASQVQNANPTQQGVVFLQLAGGKTFPVSVTGNSLNLPIARLGNRTIVQSGATSSVQQQATPVKQVIPTATVYRQQAPVVNQTIIQSPHTKTLVTPPQPRTPNCVTTRMAKSSPVLQNVRPAISVNQVTQGDIRQLINSPQKESPNPLQPWSNPNLVIRTRRASQHEATKVNCVGNQGGDHHINVDSGQSSSNVLSVSQSQSTLLSGDQQSQFISILKATTPTAASSDVIVSSDPNSGGFTGVISDSNINGNGPIKNDIKDAG